MSRTPRAASSRANPSPPIPAPTMTTSADAGRGPDPILHIVAGIKKERLVKGVLDHMAFSGKGLAAAVAKLKARNIPYELRQLPVYGTWQLFFFDPNSAKVEIDFDKSEPAPADMGEAAKAATRTY